MDIVGEVVREGVVAHGGDRHTDAENEQSFENGVRGR